MQGGPDGAKLAPALFITNNGSLVINLTEVTIEFLGPPFAIPIEFVVDAQRHNRRRVRLEEAILLLLRCLAVLLIGLVLARPFLSPQGWAGAEPRTGTHLGAGQKYTS